MKFAVVLLLCVASALALPQRLQNQKRQVDDSQNAQILTYENDNIGLDSYNFKYATSDGVQREESAVVKNFGSDVEELVVRGSISWVTPEGQTITLNYVADKDGYRADGSHI